MQDKMLIPKNEQSVIEKIQMFFRNIFSKKAEEVEKVDIPKVEERSYKDSLKDISEADEKLEILSLQELYEKGEVLEKDMTHKQVEMLKMLYKKQISEMESKIQKCKEEMEKLKASA